MRVLECQHLADQLVAGKFHDPVVKDGVLARKGRIVRSFVPVVAACHHACGLSENGQLFVVHRLGCLRSAGRFQQQTQFIELVEAVARDLRRGTIANEMLLDDEAFAFKPAEGFADRRMETLNSLTRLSTVMRVPAQSSTT